MSKIEKILQQIEDLRKSLNALIEEKDTLLDPKVINASQMLDSMLNEYNKIVETKKDK
ncbi:aspartyl-phosphate phosphatase Spo0E family protein [Clostridium sp. JN-1]|jgi:regulator of replication initiation timing|uniref:aspartyl-phosphate phosphatase Spo0E family protein n=1 Tax=Clostridium sp. JN-1 TaxID=2483110 RepID=UPI000F0B6BE6|nr:aspartyl-phosphate phosphatase Spo0E family protein [Clostridium sp. JN-1]